jgi:hypothetical protein
MQRYIQIGQSLGKPFTGSNGLGQGDSFSLMAALIMVSIQFDIVKHHYPNLRVGSCVDDRSIRGSEERRAGRLQTHGKVRF